MRKKMMMSGAFLSAVTTIVFGAGLVLAAASLLVPEKEMVIEGKKPARFDHAKHTALGVECGVCHHDKDHNPLTAENVGASGNEEQLRCMSCHNKNFANAELQKAKDVFHARCKTCHKEGYNGKNGPAKCKDCHLKTKKTAVEGC